MMTSGLEFTISAKQWAKPTVLLGLWTYFTFYINEDLNDIVTSRFN